MNNTILIVEDEKIVAMDLKLKLQKLGYDVVGSKTSGEAALEFVEKFTPDLVLMDIMIDGKLDGIDTAIRLKNDYNIPFIFLSAYSDEETIQRAKIAEPYGFILKPFEIGDLKTNIQIALYKSGIEKKLFESELRYRTLILTARDAVITHDENGIITSANESTYRLFLYKIADMIGMSIKELIPEAFVNHLEKGVRRFIHPGKPVFGDTIELRGRRKNGDIFPIELTFSQWKTKDIHSFTLIIRDITSRKEQEEALISARKDLEKKVADRTKELRALIEQSSLAICIYDISGKIIDINSQFKRIWKYIYTDIKISNYNIHSDRMLEYYKIDEEVKKLYKNVGKYKSRPLYFDIEENDGKNENALILVFNFYSVTNEDGRIFRVVNIVEDLTANIKKEEFENEINDRKLHTVSLYNRIEEERARISRELHDNIGALLYTSKINLDVLRKDIVNNTHLEKAKELLTTASTELKNIVYSLHPLMLDNYGLKAAILYLLKEVENLGYKVIINYELENVNLEKNEQLNIYRIVQEVLTNITKHAQAKNIELAFHKKEDSIYIIIQDDGVGFDMDKIQTTSKCFGIKNLKERIFLLGGDIQIETELNKGTKIYIEI